MLDSETLDVIPVSYFVSHTDDTSFFLEVEIETLIRADIVTYEFIHDEERRPYSYHRDVDTNRMVSFRDNLRYRIDKRTEKADRL